MFEDFKEKIREHSQSDQKPLSASLSPQVLDKLKKEGIDPDNFTLKQLWPEVLDKMAQTYLSCLPQKWT